MRFNLLSSILLVLIIGACTDDTDGKNLNPDPPGARTNDGIATGDSTSPKDTIAPPPRLALTPRTIRLKEPQHLVRKTEFTLNVPEGFDIAVAAEGMRRVRFMAMSPDGRLFVTDMYDLSDNRKGKIYVLEDFDRGARRFARRTVYLDGLRNPNSVAFSTDPSGRHWLYVATTDRLLRYSYVPGSSAPGTPEETIATFPDYGRSYKQGGWHLTRTVAFGDDGTLYVSVGSSCNACEEKEEERATVLAMKPDGSDKRIYASGLRNAVGIRWIDGALWATNMGADHLGLDKPEDTFYRIEEGKNYGWPYAYEFHRTIYEDPDFDAVEAGAPDNRKSSLDISDVPLAWGTFPAHSAPLGFDRFGVGEDPALRNTFLVALHGSGAPSQRRGYAIVRVVEGKLLGSFIDGFLQERERFGRPCDVLRAGENAFFFTDDHAGVVYYVYRSEA